MNPCELLDDLAEQGMTLTARDGLLLLRGREDRINPELLQNLRARKAEILCVLESYDPKIEGVSINELKRFFADDWSYLEANPDSLTMHAKFYNESKQIADGQIPAEFTSKVICIHCGEVWMPPNSLNPRNGCPWCFNRLAGWLIPPTNYDLSEE